MAVRAPSRARPRAKSGMRRCGSARDENADLSQSFVPTPTHSALSSAVLVAGGTRRQKSRALSLAAEGVVIGYQEPC